MKDLSTLVITSAIVPEITSGNAYAMDDMECLFCNSDEFRSLPDQVQQRWLNEPLYKLVVASVDDEQMAEALEEFSIVCADSIGISEGDEFCSVCDHDGLAYTIKRYLQFHVAFDGARDEEVYDEWKQVRDELEAMSFDAVREEYRYSIVNENDEDEDHRWIWIDDVQCAESGLSGLGLGVDATEDGGCIVSPDGVQCINEEGDHVDTYYFRLAVKFGF